MISTETIVFHGPRILRFLVREHKIFKIGFISSFLSIKEVIHFRSSM